MVKGSQLRKCSVCGKKLFWLVPEKDYFGMTEYRVKKINEFSARTHKYMCLDCEKKVSEKI